MSQVFHSESLEYVILGLIKLENVGMHINIAISQAPRTKAHHGRLHQACFHHYQVKKYHVV